MEDNVRNIDEAIKQLRKQIEEVYKCNFSSPRDFGWLSKQLNLMGDGISATTLKRLWGYLPNNIRPRVATLNTLSRFLGYQNFSHYLASFTSESQAVDDSPSQPVLGASIQPAREMKVNDRLQLTWQPGRSCIIRHLGAGQFVVEESEKTRLVAGNTFICELIIEGEPMYIDNLVQDKRQPIGYVCGKRNGVHFLML